MTQEYAKIAFACVDDFVSIDDDGRLRVDLEKAHQAQRAGIVELKLSNQSKQEQQVTVKLGKLQALAALAALSRQLGGLAAKPRPAARFEGLAESMESERLRYMAEVRAQRAEQALAESRAALAAAEAGRRTSGIENPNPSIFSIAREPAEPPPPRDAPPHRSGERQEPAPAEPSHRPESSHFEAMPGMPTAPPPDHRPGLYPNAIFRWSGGREHGLGPDSADILSQMKPVIGRRRDLDRPTDGVSSDTPQSLSVVLERSI